MSQISILDGTGKGFLAKVDSQFRLHMDSVTTSPLEHASEHEGNAATWVSTYAATGGQEVIYIQNTEASRRLRISRLFLFSTVDTLWTLFEVTSSSAAGGTGITPVNVNLGSGVINAENSFGDASVTGTLTGDSIALFNTLAEVTLPVYLEGAVILGNQSAIAITADATGTVGVTVLGFWEV